MKIYYLNRFLGIPKIERRIFLFGFFRLLYYSLVVRFLPLKYYFNQNNNLGYSVYATDKQLLESARKSMRRLVRLFPWRIKCLIKSLTFQDMLKKMNIPCEIRIEAHKNDSNRLWMHAYVIYEKSPINLHNVKKSCILLPIHLING